MATQPQTQTLAARTNRQRLALTLREYGIYLALGLLGIGFSIASPRFLTTDNFILILLQASVTGIISIGLLFVILSAGIDLSVGSILALAGMLSGVFAQMEPTPINMFLALMLPILVGVLCGLFNGTVIALLRVPALFEGL